MAKKRVHPAYVDSKDVTNQEYHQEYHMEYRIEYPRNFEYDSV